MMETRRFSAKANNITQLQTKPARFHSQIPAELREDKNLQRDLEVLPKNYNFEVLKTVWRLKQAKAKTVALQFPEGLLMYALIISDILKRYGGVLSCFVLGDVTYGACCVDDFTAKALQSDFLVHYGHSCLVPVDVTSIPCLYIFVTIDFDIQHLVHTIKTNFSSAKLIALAGTIQFSPAVQKAKEELKKVQSGVTVPQIKPLSPGEVLGCTAPQLADSVDVLIFISDGRFHLEAMMIANPTLPTFRYDPYNSTLTQEVYGHQTMRNQRREAIRIAREGKRWGIILSSLGRQGNPAIVNKLVALLAEHKKRVFQFVMSEILPSKVARIKHIDAWVQVGCPRLSIDWGTGFEKPVLTPYEAMVALKSAPEFWKEDGEEVELLHHPYPMDYYARESGPWSSSYHKNKNLKPKMQTS